MLVTVLIYTYYSLICHHLNNYWLIIVVTVKTICHYLPVEHKLDQMPVNPAVTELIWQCLCSVCVRRHTQYNKQPPRSISVNSRGYTTLIWSDRRFQILMSHRLVKLNQEASNDPTAALEKHSATGLHTEEGRRKQRWNDSIYSSVSVWFLWLQPWWVSHQIPVCLFFYKLINMT